ncbi:hypothetical protein MPH_09659 [Macrophomina phaseolina MS6]|uniref:Uncharacterized protein n=2 Tax=Macrophomina phaseolina TaxID=35725 RepID=K2RK42_MACPH|nr:hypothetical protein MPH_09659 [Macrophomina phaseolina MS6]KAH7034305.1 hypothetical protein B0J12DRAFT_276166 [Macrophomina phaseolina]
MSGPSNQKLSEAKIQPLDSETKHNIPHDESDRGVAGTNRAIDQARIDPIGGHGQYQHPAPHADSQGVVGRDGAFAGAKIEPLEGKQGATVGKSPGLDDEAVDGARINPLGEVREQTP